MSLVAFKLPAEDVRLLEYEKTIYKIKLKYDSQDAFLPCSQRELHKEVVEVLKILLQAKFFTDMSLTTDHFNVQCQTSDWEVLEFIGFARDGELLKAHPLMFSLVFQPRQTNHIVRKITSENVTNEGGLSSSESYTSGNGREIKRKEDLSTGNRDMNVTMGYSANFDTTGSITELTQPEIVQENQSNSGHDSKIKHVICLDTDMNPDMEGTLTVVKLPMRHNTDIREKNKNRESPKKRSAFDPMQIIQIPPKVLRVEMGKKLSEEELLISMYRSQGKMDGAGDSNKKTKRDGHLTSPGNIGASGDHNCQVTKHLMPTYRPPNSVSSIRPKPADRSSSEESEESSIRRSRREKKWYKKRPTSEESTSRSSSETSPKFAGRPRNGKLSYKKSPYRKKLRKRRSSSFGQAVEGFLDCFH